MDGTISSPILSKLQKHHVGGGRKDMISDLPESVLSSILSLLSTEEAVRTSILATKWRYSWTHLSVYRFRCVSKPNQKPADCLVDLVNKLLEKSNCLEIENLYIELHGNVVDGRKVSSMLSSVLMHKVRHLYLHLDSKNSSFALPKRFSASQSLTYLYISFGFLDFIPDGICFPSLKILHIEHLTFRNQKSAQRLLNGCPVLEDLTLHKCYWVKIKPFRVSIPTLRSLTVHFRSSVFDRNYCTIEIDAVNLSSLSYTSNPTINCFLINSTSIVNANIDLSFFYIERQLQKDAALTIELLIRLRSVEYLRLSDETIECLNYAKSALHHLPLFNNLTHLEVVFCQRCEVFADILHKTPNLEVLYISEGIYLSLDDEELPSDSLPCCFKSSLKLCSISDFSGDGAEIQLVKFLLENVTVLRKIEIFCTGSLSKNSKKLAYVRNQLQPFGMGICDFKFCSPYW